jgi:hypothetical protein
LRVILPLTQHSELAKQTRLSIHPLVPSSIFHLPSHFLFLVIFLHFNYEVYELAQLLVLVLVFISSLSLSELAVLVWFLTCSFLLFILYLLSSSSPWSWRVVLELTRHAIKAKIA